MASTVLRIPVHLSLVFFRCAASPLSFGSPKCLSYPLQSPFPPRHYHTSTKMSATSANKDDGFCAIRERKQALRKEIRSRMKTLSTEEIQKESSKVWERLFQMPEYQTARSVALFLSMPKGEICTDAVVEDAVTQGKDIYVPQVGKNFEQADMEMLKVTEPKTTDGTLFHKAWPRNKWGIPEPPEDMPVVAAGPGTIDLIVVPGLAFDQRGDRLGQGKGYYDRFIERMSSGPAKPPVLIAVGLDCQVVDSIPVNEFDQSMDKVILPSQVIIVKKD